MNVVTPIKFDEYMQIRVKGISSEMEVYGVLRDGFIYKGNFYYIGKYCFKVSKM